MHFAQPLLLFCLIAWSNFAFAQPCTDQWVYPSICPGDTLVLYAPPCSNCTYNWTTPPLNGNNGSIAKYLFENDPVQAHTYFSFYMLDVEVTDLTQNCTYTYHQESYQSHYEEIEIIPLDGVWSGSASPQRYVISYYDDSGGYEQSPTWQITGGTITQTQTGLVPWAWPFATRTDTIHIQWNANGPWNIDLTMNTLDTRSGWPNFTHFNCDLDYSQKVGPNALITGDSVVCPQGDTISYTVEGALPFSYNWLVSGGTLLSGQSTDSVVIAWPANPVGTLQAFVTFNGTTDSSTIQVTEETYPSQFLRPDLITCTPYSSIYLDARGANGQEYIWSTGETTPTISINLPGLNYFVDVIDTGCGIVSKDTFEYIVLPVILPNLGPDTSICADTQITLDPGPDFSNHTWSDFTNDSVLIVTQPGQYSLYAQDTNGCTNYDTIQIGVRPDCVFPGDADYDGVANNFDVLAIGANFGSVGLPRSSANLQWYGQVAPDWVDTLTATVNMKQVDTDGNALVNADDTLAIALNYGFTHSKAQGIETAGVPLSIRAGFDSVFVGDTAVYHISLGDSAYPADSVYGIAFTINYDTALTDTQGLLFTDFSNCWIAPNGSCMTFSYDRYPEPHADIAVVRTDGQDTSGFGDICRIGFVTIDNISGKRTTLYEPFHVSISDILFIDKDMNAREAAGGMDSTILVEEETRIAQALPGTQLQVYPLPAAEMVFLTCVGEALVQVRVFDLSGKLVLSQTLQGKARERLGVEQLKPGAYSIEVKSRQGNVFREKMLLMQ